MGGVNPYIQAAKTQKPERPFKVTFQMEDTGEKIEVPVDPAQIPFGDHGLEGSLLDIAEGAGVEINHSCGGVCACSTCHVYVAQGLETCSPSTDDEEDMLDEAPAVTTESRLSCQCVPNGKKDLLVIVPRWNRNEVKEGHG
ncbi:2Fe-2S iron-sulfur cluster-binding protein [Limnoglobus roseus]|uniref:Ferredoxin n=1 Tax=Limnoglobus roseus TaxID=2598579 RepID=A0A5C1AP01_9BACT|nr:2Fe-2S iron-sulfur cluster-binding protein [Limnoglobus roseus]QEL21129.1 ferredoxin [Limnoglobus roseus]